MGDNNPDRLQTAEETAAQTTLAASTLAYYRSVGKGPPYHKLGRRVVYRRGDVEQWIQQQRVQGEE